MCVYSTDNSQVGVGQRVTVVFHLVQKRTIADNISAHIELNSYFTYKVSRDLDMYRRFIGPYITLSPSISTVHARASKPN